MKARVIVISSFILCFAFGSKAQTSLSFYHLGNATFQNTRYNPAFVPKAKAFLGLPVISGVHLHYNNRVSYENATFIQENGNRKWDPNGILKSLGPFNSLSFQTNIDLLHFGLVTKNGLFISFSANERIESDLFYNNRVMRFLIDGNRSVVDQKVQLEKTRFSLNYFREFGIGAAYPTSNEDIILGARLKYLQGILNFSTPASQKANISTDGEDYTIRADAENFMLRSAGYNVLSGETGNIGSYLVSNGNVGLAVDLGMDWQMNKWNKISLSIVDLGFISWQEDIENRYVSDTVIVFEGINDLTRKISNLETILEDSLIGDFSLKKNNEAYVSSIGTKVFGTWTYKVNDFGGDMVTSFGARYYQRNLNMLLGIGYQQKFGNFFVGSINVTKLPQQFLNLGAALSVRGGPVQYYLAVDQIYNFDVTKFKSFDFRMGINFVFNTREEGLTRNAASTTYDSNKIKQRIKGPGWNQSQSFMGRRVKILRREGIYNIIEKQKRRDPEEYKSDPQE